MLKDVLQKLLAEACGGAATAEAFEIKVRDRASILLATDGPLEGLENVTKIELRQGYLRVEVDGGSEVFWVDLERVVGLKLQRSKREGAGFVSDGR